MSNSLALIGPISIGGSLTLAGLPNVNGKVWAYLPGTTTPANIYADPAGVSTVTQPLMLDAGGRTPYATYPNGVYTAQPIRLFIQDVNGVTVSDTTFETGAASTGMANAGFPNETTVDQGFAALYGSLGGIDGQYLPYAGGAPMSVKAALSGIQLTPESFGAVGDLNHDDTSAIQAMVTKLAALGGGVGWFAPKTGYKTSAPIVFPSGATGIALAGASRSSLIQNVSTSDTFTSTSATGISFVNLTISGTSALTGAVGLIWQNVTTSLGSSSSAYGLSLSGCSRVSLQDCTITGASKVVALAGITQNVYLTRCSLGAGLGVSTACIDVAGATSNVLVRDTIFSAGSGGVTGMKFESGASGTTFLVADCPGFGGVATPVDTSAISNDPSLVVRNSGMDFILQDSLVADAGHTYTPSAFYGTTEFRVTSVSGGASLTIAPPSPAATALQKGKVFSTYHVNASGGGVTWVFPAAAGQYLTNVSVPTANGTKFNMSWKWDGSNWNLNSTGQAV